MKHMYFGPGVNSETKSEYWHGTLWGESPLFGQNEITISEDINNYFTLDVIMILLAFIPLSLVTFLILLFLICALFLI
jgi:hypothetical protein